MSQSLGPHAETLSRRMAVFSAACWGFWLEPTPRQPYVVFRRLVATIAILQLWLIIGDLELLYGNRGLVQWSIIEAGALQPAPTVGKLARLLEPTGISASDTLWLVAALYALSLFGLLTGLRPRAFAVVALLARGLMVGSGHLSLYGLDVMLQCCLFYLIWMDSSDRGSVRSPHSIPKRMVQLHLCLIYLDAGLAKAAGAQWWTGEALWQALMQPQFATRDFSMLSEVPTLMAAAAIAVIVLETGYPFLIWWPRVRPWWLGAIVALHVGIAVSMGLVLFSATMVAMNLMAFAPPSWPWTTAKAKLSSLLRLPFVESGVRPQRR